MRSRTKVPAKRRWRVIIIRNRGQVLGDVEAATRDAAKLAAIKAFGLNSEQRKRLLLLEYG